MTCKGCPGTQKQVGEEQAELADAFARAAESNPFLLVLSARVNACHHCEQFAAFWKCHKIGTSAAFRATLRDPKGECPEGHWPAAPRSHSDHLPGKMDLQTPGGNA